MPVIAYSLGPLAIVARYTRTSMLEVLRSDYVRLARARGLPQHRVLRRYVLRNALVPLITVLGPAIPDILTGSIFIESTFALPGIGRFFTTSALTRDYPMIMAMMLLVAFLWGFTYLVSDLLYGLADPRVRLGGARL
jgi:ABC-type dipeptide/oligopeptide/nickel transport system permease component